MAPHSLQYFCLENPMAGGAWQVAVHGVAKSQTRLSDFFQFSLSCIGEGNGNPVQCSCLENPRDGVTPVGCRLWGHTESDMTEATQQQHPQYELYEVICPKRFQPFASLTHFSFKYSTSHFTKVIPLIHSIGSQCEIFRGTIPEGIASKFLVSKVNVLEEGDCNFIMLEKLVRCFTLSPLSLSSPSLNSKIRRKL